VSRCKVLAHVSAAEQRCIVSVVAFQPGSTDLDSVPSLQNRSPVNLADQIADHAEQSAFLPLFERTSPAEMRARAEAFVAQFPQSAFLAQAQGRTVSANDVYGRSAGAFAMFQERRCELRDLPRSAQPRFQRLPAVPYAERCRLGAVAVIVVEGTASGGRAVKTVTPRWSKCSFVGDRPLLPGWLLHRQYLVASNGFEALNGSARPRDLYDVCLLRGS
jgi:hypothetical protein